MKYCLALMLVSSVVLSTVGCGGSSVDDTKQPKIQGPPDERLKPATPGGGGASTIKEKN